jgi:diacylglycerol kinase
MLPGNYRVSSTRRASYRLVRAFRGAKCGVRGESVFFVYFFSTALVLAAATALEASLLEWAVLLLCITAVLWAEMFNTALQRLNQALRQPGSKVEALDVGHAAVLVTLIGAGSVIALILFARLRTFLSG